MSEITPKPKQESKKTILADNIKLDDRDETIYSGFTDRLLSKLKKNTNKLHVILWTFPQKAEIGFKSLWVPLDTKEFNYRGKFYHIDEQAIKNRLGILTYDCHINNAIGALRFIKPEINRDASNSRDLLQRGVLNQLWHNSKMPFIVLMISLGICLTLGVLLAIFVPSYLQLDAENDALKLQLQNILNPPIPEPILPSEANGGT